MRKIHLLAGLVIGIFAILLCMSYIANSTLDMEHGRVVAIGIVIAGLHIIHFKKENQRGGRLGIVAECIHAVSGAVLALMALVGFVLVAFMSAWLDGGTGLALSDGMGWLGMVLVPLNIVFGLVATIPCKNPKKSVL